jgi:hypothetical protein
MSGTAVGAGSALEIWRALGTCVSASVSACLSLDLSACDGYGYTGVYACMYAYMRAFSMPLVFVISLASSSHLYLAGSI